MLPLLLALASIGCTSQPLEPTATPGAPSSSQPTEPTHAAEPPIVGEPLPGSFYLISDPALAPYAVTVRVDYDLGRPSERSEEFEAGDEVVVNWSDLPHPEGKWIEVNGQDCEGTFVVHARIETDLLLSLTDDGCRIGVLGFHPEGGAHWQDGGRASP